MCNSYNITECYDDQDIQDDQADQVVQDDHHPQDDRHPHLFHILHLDPGPALVASSLPDQVQDGVGHLKGGMAIIVNIVVTDKEIFQICVNMVGYHGGNHWNIHHWRPFITFIISSLLMQPSRLTS